MVLSEEIPQNLGLESQRDFSTINKKLKGNRMVDFCFTSPYLHWSEQKKCKSFILEAETRPV